jgi:hypothetical protein
MLYEMATGKRPFLGKTQIKVVSAILEDDPPSASQLRHGLPPAMDYVIGTCLQKIPDDRYHSAHDIALELKWISEMSKQRPAQTQNTSKLWIVAALFLGVVVGGLVLYSLSPKSPAQPVALSILPPSGITFNLRLYGRRRFLLMALTSWLSGLTAAVPVCCRCVRLTARLHATARNRGASYPFWSPDGKQIGFTSNFLKIVDVAGRSVMDLCPVAEGAAARGIIARDCLRKPHNGLFRVPASGGTATALTNLTNMRGKDLRPTTAFPSSCLTTSTLLMLCSRRRPPRCN